MGPSGLSISSVTGQTALKKVSQVANSDVLHLAGEFTAKGAPGEKSPFSSGKASMHAMMSGEFPTDETKAAQVEIAIVTMTFDASGKPDPNGPEVQVTGDYKLSGRRTYKLLK